MAERKICANPGCETKLELNIIINDTVLFNVVVKLNINEVKKKNKKILHHR